MSKAPDGSPVPLPLAPISEHAHLATPPDMIRWDLGERATLDAPNERLAVVTIAGRKVAIEGRFSRGVQELGEPTPIPLSPEHILGLCHVRGHILPAVDLALYFDPNSRHGRGASSKTSSRTALVLEIDEVAFCLCVDEVVAFEPFQMDRLQSSGSENNDLDQTAPEKSDLWQSLWAGQAVLEMADLDSDPPSDRAETIPVLDLPAAVKALRFGESS